MVGDHHLPARFSEGPHAPKPTLRHPTRNLLRRPSTWLSLYGVALALIAFWPEHVDKNFSPLIEKLIAVVPLLTYQRLEFGANIALFIPLGLLLTMMLHRRPHLTLPIAVICSVAIESAQAVLLEHRTPSVLDIIANTAGACIGIVLAEISSAGKRAKSV